ncbi:MAG: TrmH family RNA methyltransferase [Candidatus Pacebacteria bacterium]|nr:TrmH family RNA methyltransferase [Candidatus Paceibacterota bacterium]
MKSNNSMKVVVVLPDIRSSYNVGSIFRTCDAVGVSEIVLAGYSPRPVDKFNRPQKEIAKTALGAEKDVPWVYKDSSLKALRDLKNEGFRIIAVEQTERSIDYKVFFKDLFKRNKNKKGKKTKSNNLMQEIKLAIVFGTEVTGIPKGLLKLCDDCIDIPMKGNKESLNVSVSAGIILYELI